ncbi:MAG: hypothetical protein LH472_15545 [Pyrinomonadaceae bacterium]|nr:hypothetical protein [Pyrinomonadaceae bacterium]
MKNIKNTIAAMSLMAVLGLGATTANAGLMLSDRSGNGQQTCGDSTGGILNEAAGIIIVGVTSALTGILIVGRGGLMLSDRPTPCVEAGRDGLIIVG